MTDVSEWRAANPERTRYHLAKQRAKPEHRSYMQAYQADYAARPENREKARARTAAYRKANAGRVNAVNAKRRAAELQATPKWLTANDYAIMAAIYDVAQRTGMQVDHYYPLQGKTVCGLHVPDNLQLLTPAENMAKGNRLEFV